MIKHCINKTIGLLSEEIMAEKETVCYKVVEISHVNGKKILHSMVAGDKNKVVYTVGSWSESEYPVLAFESLEDARQFAFRETRFETTNSAEIYTCSAKNAALIRRLLDPWHLYNREWLGQFWNANENTRTILAPRGTVACASVMLKECVASYPILEE